MGNIVVFPRKNPNVLPRKQYLGSIKDPTVSCLISYRAKKILEEFITNSLVPSQSREGKELLKGAEDLFGRVLKDPKLDGTEARRLLALAEEMSSRVHGPGDPFWRE